MIVATGCAGPAPSVGGPSPASPAALPPVALALTAKGVELQPASLTAPAGRDLALTFDNTDAGIPHGLVLYADQAHTITLGTAPLVVGPDHQVFHVAGLAPGRYQFSCVVHPNMVADLVVQPAS